MGHALIVMVAPALQAEAESAMHTLVIVQPVAATYSAEMLVASTAQEDRGKLA